jgi:hypothetical protein
MPNADFHHRNIPPDKTVKKVQNHSFFGMLTNDSKQVDEIMNQLRKDRYHSLDSKNKREQGMHDRFATG